MGLTSENKFYLFEISLFFETYRIKATQHLLREFASGTINFLNVPFQEHLHFSIYLHLGFYNSSHNKSGDPSVLRALTSYSRKVRATCSIIFTGNLFCFKESLWRGASIFSSMQMCGWSHNNSTWAKTMQFNLQVCIVGWAEHDTKLTGPWSEVSSGAQQWYSGTSVGRGGRCLGPV